MKKIILAFALTTSLLLISACNNAEVASDVIVATKAGEITKDALYEEMKGSIGIQVVENLILKKAIEHEHKIEESELKEAIKKQKEQLGDNFEQYLKQKNITADYFETQVEFSLLQQKLMASLDEVTDEEIDAEYAKMNKEIHARHILVDDEKTAKEVIKKLQDGGDFAKLAKEYSIEPKADESGGDLGWFGVGKMVTPFEDAAFTLPEKEISEPIKSSFGYHVIEVLESRETELEKTFEELKTVIEETIKKKKFEEKLIVLLQNIDVEIKDDAFKSALDGYINSIEK